MKPKLLVVDDDEDIRVQMKWALYTAIILDHFQREATC